VQFLLDTHVWIWLRLRPARLKASTRKTIEHSEVLLSVVTAWELANDRRGKFSRDLPLPCSVDAARFPLLPIVPQHIETLATLPWHHADPFDRMLVAQALAEGLVIVTADRAIRNYDIATLAA
jgi:PIN domain nuclease of toxin-antitoxin system